MDGQGAGSSPPTLTLEDPNISQTFSEMTTFAQVPEPGFLSMFGGFTLVACHLICRRRLPAQRQ